MNFHQRWYCNLLRLLQLLTECFILTGSAMFNATSSMVTRSGPPHFLEHWRKVVWKLIKLTKLFLPTEISCKVTSTLCWKWFKISSTFCTFRSKQFGPNFVSTWSKYVSYNVWSDFRLPVPAFATVARKSFNGKFTTKNDFSVQTFYVTIIDADIGSLKSLHILFNKYLNHMPVKLEQIVWHKIHTILSFFGKNVNHF